MKPKAATSAVVAAKDYIKKGDAFQIVPSIRLEGPDIRSNRAATI